MERCTIDSNSYTYTDDNFGVKSGAGGSLTSRVSIEEFRPGSNIMGGEIYNYYNSSSDNVDQGAVC